MKTDDPNLELRFAQGAEEIRAAQALRYRVFVEELGASHPDVDHEARIERDQFDSEVLHLCLFDKTRLQNDPERAVVGVYRLITEECATKLGGFYSQNEFSLDNFLALPGRKLELGRSCIDQQYRGGAAMALLWSGLGAFVEDHQIDYLFGSASFHGTNAAAFSAALSYLYHHHLIDDALGVRVAAENGVAMNMMPAGQISRLEAMRQIPTLIKAYLRLGGQIGDGAYIDNEFNTTDVFVLMQTKNMVEKYRAMYR